jgi:hypothetical protein
MAAEVAHRGSRCSEKVVRRGMAGGLPFGVASDGHPGPAPRIWEKGENYKKEGEKPGRKWVDC